MSKVVKSRKLYKYSFLFLCIIFEKLKQNMSMNTLEIVTILVVVLVFLAILPIFIRIEWFVNVLENVGVVALNLWGIRVKCIQFRLSKEVITIVKKGGKTKQIKLNLFDPQVIFMRYFIKSMFSLIILRHIRVYVDVGSTGNALFASLIGGGVYAMLESVFAIIKTRKSYAELLFDIVPHSETNEGKVCGSASIVICPIFLLYSLFRAKFLQKRWFKTYERYSV